MRIRQLIFVLLLSIAYLQLVYAQGGLSESRFLEVTTITHQYIIELSDFEHADDFSKKTEKYFYPWEKRDQELNPKLCKTSFLITKQISSFAHPRYDLLQNKIINLPDQLLKRGLKYLPRLHPPILLLNFLQVR